MEQIAKAPSLSLKEQILVGQNIVLTILTIAGLTLAYKYPLLSPGGANIFPGPAVFLITALALDVSIIFTIFSEVKILRYRFVVWFSHMVTILLLYAVLGGALPGLSVLGALVFVCLALLAVPFPKDHGDPLTDRGLKILLASLILGLVEMATVLTITGHWTS